MVSKCTNPECSAVFRYLGEGRLFRFELERPEPRTGGEKKIVRKVEFFWLCAKCAAKNTLALEAQCRVALTPLPSRPVHHAVAS